MSLVPAVVPSYEGRCMIMLTYGNATLDILRRHILLPIEVDKGTNHWIMELWT